MSSFRYSVLFLNLKVMRRQFPRQILKVKNSAYLAHIFLSAIPNENIFQFQKSAISDSGNHLLFTTILHAKVSSYHSSKARTLSIHICKSILIQELAGFSRYYDIKPHYLTHRGSLIFAVRVPIIQAYPVEDSDKLNFIASFN